MRALFLVTSIAIAAAQIGMVQAAGAQSVTFEALNEKWWHEASEFTSKADSLAHTRTLAAVKRATALRVAVSLAAREIIVMDNEDTLLIAPVAVATGETLAHGKHMWTFRLPRGVYFVKGARTQPIWTPPLWHYAEVAQDHDLKVEHLRRGRKRFLKDGSYLETRGNRVGLKRRGEAWMPMLETEEIVFDKIVFVPPAGTVNSMVEGALGPYALDLGQGYMIHGTPDQRSIGRAATHGCLRMRDEDITWMYENIPPGTRVYVY